MCLPCHSSWELSAAFLHKLLCHITDPPFLTLGAELANGLDNYGSRATAWVELQPCLPSPHQGAAWAALAALTYPPPAAPFLEGKISPDCKLQLPNLDVTSSAVLSWHWGNNSWVPPQSAQSWPWLCSCRSVWTVNKIPSNFISWQRPNPDDPAPGVSARGHRMSPL